MFMSNSSFLILKNELNSTKSYLPSMGKRTQNVHRKDDLKRASIKQSMKNVQTVLLTSKYSDSIAHIPPGKRNT